MRSLLFSRPHSALKKSPKKLDPLPNDNIFYRKADNQKAVTSVSCITAQHSIQSCLVHTHTLNTKGMKQEKTVGKMSQSKPEAEQTP